MKCLLMAGLPLCLSGACGGTNPRVAGTPRDAGTAAMDARLDRGVDDAGAQPTCPVVVGTSPPLRECAGRADGSSPLVDDFETGTSLLPAAEGRSGEWYTFTDGTAGCIRSEVVTDGSSRALHLSGGGFSRWGAGFGTTWDWSNAEQGMCTYDLSAYSGIRFRARGDAWLRVEIPSRETTVQSAGGTCPDDASCFDAHGRNVVLTSDDQEFVLPFCAFATQGWGPVSGSLDLTSATNLNFLINTTSNFDVWIDDVALVPRSMDAGAACAPLCPADEVAVGLVPAPTVTRLDQAGTGVRLYTFPQSTKDCGTVTRRYLAYVPPTLTASSSAPIVIVLHGSGADAEAMRTEITQARFEALAAQDGFIVVYGNAAPSSTTVPALPNGGGFRRDADAEVDDAAYLRMIVDDLTSRGAITGTNPVFLAGLSDGGGMAYIAGLRDPSRYLGLGLIMPFPGSPPPLPVATPGSTIQRVLLSYTPGDPGMPPGFPPLLAPTGPAWAQAIGVPAEEVAAPIDTALPDVVKEGDGYTGSVANAIATEDSTAETIDYGSDPSGALCRVIRFDHAGHLWPVPNPRDSDTLIGMFGFRNQDMDMSDVLWTFFRSALASTSR